MTATTALHRLQTNKPAVGRNKRPLRMVLFSIAVMGCASYALAQVPRTASPAGASAYFIAPKNGASIKGPVKVVMGLAGMGIAPAGMEAPDTGHHHILVNADNVNMEMPLPADDKHRHFGKGQTETTLDLPPGKYSLQLLLGDRNHIPHNPPVVSGKISITVTK